MAQATVPCKYKTGKTLGSGTYAVVKEAVHIDTGEHYACKVSSRILRISYDMKLMLSYEDHKQAIDERSRAYGEFLNTHVSARIRSSRKNFIGPK